MGRMTEDPRNSSSRSLPRADEGVATLSINGRARSASANAAHGRPERISAIVVALAGVAFGLYCWMTLPYQPAFILSLATVLAYAAWMTTYAYPVRSRGVIAVYLLAVGFQLLHMMEEYTGDFAHEIVVLFDSPRDWTEKSFLLTFVFVFGALYFFAGAGALYQIRVANFFLWWYALGAGLLNAIAHFVFPILKGGYFPGAYTAAGHLIMSSLLIYLLVKERRDAIRGQAGSPSLMRPRGSTVNEDQESSGGVLPSQ